MNSVAFDVVNSVVFAVTNSVELDSVEPNSVEPNSVEPNSVEPNSVEPNSVELDWVVPNGVVSSIFEVVPKVDVLFMPESVQSGLFVGFPWEPLPLPLPCFLRKSSR